jgi:hypothetical protein
MADRVIRVTTSLAVAAVAAVAAVISYRHAYELVTTHGETGLTARLLPFTVDGLILAASMLILDASRRHQPVPPLVPGRRHHRHHRRQPGPRPGPRTHRGTGQRLALAGSFELLMTLIRTEPPVETTATPTAHANRAATAAANGAPPVPAGTPAVEQTVRAWHRAGRSQRAIARDLGIDRRKIKRIIDHPT